MTLAKKIAALRGERRLSQGDLAERLDVSRQSVSKWETGQSVPELDKLIKLADLFGVTVDELVRNGDAPKAAEPSRAGTAPAAQPETKIIYVERPRRRLTPVQILGVICVVAGVLLCVVGDAELTVLGAAMIIASLPLLLVKKHPLLVCGWLAWAVGYLFLCNPALTGVYWQPFTAVWGWCPLRGTAYVFVPVIWLLWVGFVALSALTIVLPVYTGWLCWKRWAARKTGRQENQAA